jgi:hypothetical protein
MQDVGRPGSAALTPASQADARSLTSQADARLLNLHVAEARWAPIVADIWRVPATDEPTTSPFRSGPCYCRCATLRSPRAARKGTQP